MKPSIGTFHDDGAAVIDLPRLLETRMLIQANSGGGKSWAIRRLLEQTAGHVQQLVIDPEGEFATLREKHDYVIAAAHDGDALAHPKTAQILARRLLETGVSAILDIYDLKAHERQAFVRLFLDALTNAPKALWQPCLVVLDEAHVFCPEAGKAESAGAVIDLATRGRKRGFCLIAATQRLAKLHKDTAAELLNKLVGRTGLDVDVKRAGDELGMTPREAMEKLRPLTAGEFFAFGPALSLSVRRLKVGDVKTTHPKAGDRTLKAPPKPTAAIVAVLPKLADLPKEAEAEARTVEDLKRELANTRRELTQAKNAKPGASREDVQAAEARGFERGHAAGAGEAQRTAAAHFKTLKGALHQVVESALAGAPTPSRPAPAPAARTAVNPSRQPRPAPPARVTNGSGASIAKGEAAVLAACIQFPDGLRREQITVLTGYKRSTRDAYIQRLREKGYISGEGDLIVSTDEGCAALPDAEPLPTGEALQDYWFNRLPEGERAILRVLVDRHPAAVLRDDLTVETGYKRSTRDAYLQRLSAKQLVSEPSRGEVMASRDLFA
jgi:uncharacterized protein